MRISDWSSDVCSSDLQRAVRGLKHDLRERPGGVEPMAVKADIIFAALHPVDRQPVDELGVRRAAQPPEKRDPAADRLRPASEAAHRAFARTEEHTSELQSLMRNPYAVFCLQKNTRQQPA